VTPTDTLLTATLAVRLAVRVEDAATNPEGGVA
jgi:hypothetical protein